MPPFNERRLPMPKDRLTHVQLLFTWNPSPLRPSKFSFEYLLLPPRSAPAAAPPRLAPQASVLTAAALLLVAAWQPRIARTAATVRYRSDAQGTCTLNNFTKSPARARPALLEHFTESKSHVGLPCHVRAQRSAWHGSLDMAFLFALRIADGLFP